MSLEIKLPKINRAKMCKNKISFRSKAAALEKATKFNQRVYECPICFCWHTTSKENWEDLYVPIEKHQNLVRDTEKFKVKAEQTLIRYGKTIRDLNQIIHDQNLEIKELKERLRNGK